MSVVNKMLNDLEQREKAPTVQANYQPTVKKALPVRLLLIIAVGILAIAVVMLWPMPSSESANPSLVVTPVNQVTETTLPAVLDTNKHEQELGHRNADLPLPPSNQRAENAQMGSDAPRLPAAQTPVSTAVTRPAETTPVVVNSTVSEQQEQTVLPSPSKPSVRSASDPNKRALKAQIADAIARNDVDESIRLLQVLSLQQPNNIGAKKRLAALFFSEGRHRDAQRLLQQTLSLFPADSSVRLMYARLMAQQNELDLSFYTLQQADEYPPADIELLGFRASVAQQLGKLDSALQDYNRLVAIDALNGKWWLGRAVVADKLGQSPLAVASYREAIALHSLDADVEQFMQQRLKLLSGGAP